MSCGKILQIKISDLNEVYILFYSFLYGVQFLRKFVV